MEFVKVIDTAELLAGKMKRVVVGDQQVLLTNVAGTYYAIANPCTHSGNSLADGKLEASTVTCPNHGAQFDVKTGECVTGAKIAFMRKKVKNEETYQVKLEGTTVMIGKP